jgi:hypothetical protein
VKTCTRCGLGKPLSAFAARRKSRGTLQSWCRDCHRAHAAERYRGFSADQLRTKTRNEHVRRAVLRARVWEILRTRWCADCGEPDPVVLDFDHLREKRGNIADLVSAGASWSSIEFELQKCEVRCGNCHRRRTAELRAETSAPTPERKRSARAQRRAKHAATPGVRADGRGESKDRLCPRCGKWRPLEAFAWRSRRRGERQPWCRDCHNAHKRAFYAANRGTETIRVALRREPIVRENLDRLRSFLEDHPCVDCGEHDVIVLEFDHVTGRKRADVTTMVRGGLIWTTIEHEIAKCEVRCVNCHRRRTAGQRGFRDRKGGLAEPA